MTADLVLLAVEQGRTSPVLQTLAVSIVAGVLLVLLSRQLKMSSIALLLLGGVLLGPEFLGWVQPDKLGKALGPLISLCVALILFEGGLSLNLDGYRSASSVIRKLLSVGVLITWGGIAAIVYLLFGDMLGESRLSMSVLAASLVIVTGPTVIAPLLRRIRIRQNLNDILHWEGVLIDPIGVFIAILTYEYVTGMGAGEALVGFGYRVLVGLVIGGATGLAMAYVLRKNWIPDDNLNIFIVGVAIFVFAFDDYLIPESGLLGVTVAGLVLGWKRPGPLKAIKQFKAEITDLLIGALFVLLAATLDFDDFKRFGWNGLIAVIAVMFVVRPLNVFVCTLGSKLTLKEKLFLSYVSPRGIVAASMASLFALSLQDTNENAWFLVAFTFSVIGITVVLQGLTAGILARLLGLKLPMPTGWLIVGAHPFARRIAKFITSRGKVECYLIDANRKLIQEAKNEGLNAAYADARDPELSTRNEYRGVGNVLALTDNEELNMIICQRWWSAVGRKRVFRWGTQQSSTEESHEQPGVVVWTSLPKPSLVASELMRNDITITLGMAGKARKSDGMLALMQANPDSGVLIDPDVLGDRDRPAEKTEVLLLKREADYLIRSIKPELVVRLENIQTQEDLFKALVERALLVEPRIDRTELLNELIEREKSFPTALGHGIAVPHGYSGQVNQRLCAVSQIPAGLEFGAPDGQPVKLAFLIISPKGDPEGHLATMAEIARLVADAELRERLLQATDTADILTTLTAAEKRAQSG